MADWAWRDLAVTEASASGKAILLGEHAVVYGRPAIAVPVSDRRARVTVSPLSRGQGIWIEALDLGQSFRIDRAESLDIGLPLQTTVRNTLDFLSTATFDLDLRIAIRSQIPVARGMGSGTAVATAIVRALAAHFGQDLGPQEVSDLVFQTEVVLHGTPSGVDNTVVSYEQPVYFARERELFRLGVGQPLILLIADTGVPSRTRDTVAAVRQRWQEEPQRFDHIFDSIGGAVDDARDAIGNGQIGALGRLMDLNQQLLCELDVSSVELDRLVRAARDAQALGAKLSGGGGGGCMIALVTHETQQQVAAALSRAGAVQTIATDVR